MTLGPSECVEGVSLYAQLKSMRLFTKAVHLDHHTCLDMLPTKILFYLAPQCDQEWSNDVCELEHFYKNHALFHVILVL